ncbi:MAG: thioesterase family protein [Cupriavidus sp.]|nr:MAG: thioesterase family protein [Cupriavidus sp.]
MFHPMSNKTGFTPLLTQARADGDALVFNVTEDWTQGRTAFGGLQAAMALTAMRKLVPANVPLRVLQVTFIGPVLVGEVTVQARVLRTGKSVTHAEARLMSGSDTGCLVVGVFGSERESVLKIDNTVYPQLPAVDSLKDMPLFPGVTPRLLEHCGLRWARSTPPFSGASAARASIYVRLDEPVSSDAHMAALCDIIPTPALSMLKKPAPASSLTWTLEILRSDYVESGAQPGWWLMDAEVTRGQGGYLSQTALLWDAQKRPVALSRQTVTVFA